MSTSIKAAPMTAAERKVIFASSLGTVFEWYDFYLYGSLAAVIAKQFFSGLDAGSAFIFALLAFAAGFIVRPFGALVFGRLGDLIGRKYTFLVTIMIMGGSTFVVGILPNYATIGVAAPVLLIALRLLQGLALGGEYGGAATYVAEHAPNGKRGAYTAWIQTTATMGLFLSLLVILFTREFTGPDFEVWGWRVPFIVSIALLGVSVWIRMSMNESPAFKKMKEDGKLSKSPLGESFGQWKNLKIVILALFGLVAGQAVVWYTGQFYALFYLTQVLKVDAKTANLLIAASLLVATPFFVVFGSLSDRIGRKVIIMGGLLLAVITYIPNTPVSVFNGLTHFANPALENAMATSPATITADLSECTFQFNPTGTAKFTSSCDIAKQVMASNSASYTTIAGPAGSVAKVKIGETEIEGYSAKGLDPAEAKAKDTAFKKAIRDDLTAAGYPVKADPAAINYFAVFLLLTFLVLLVTMVYGPIAAMLVEMFPTRIRYTSMSLPYHIGNGWFGGLLPTISFALVAQNGNIYYGLWYPIIIAAMTLVIGTLFVRETKDVDIYARD
ncbi:MHS family MFS transporter [Polynucleobacter paneuropaeus]|uniref:MHS family MFS transporter n=1 Tax=Polynucleobacter paneuropaeus TaxID=2527775 RepID=A0A9Q2ZUX2_9BURK|nr:MHS family MFS transporter [Polynucleobacter paneuropaeus]MBT8578039.1 MHS family MFS transporter [Polynucleobacter paneuropaeus]MBT8583596.1 MHS family MFS transporter [Polynucleobacter paneuropaeus]QWD00076.1 MHS family MFS transporter [Polynucleobacter paneuropaeus]QWD38665.1 MHS family MFS transporter [Polynucleobacter paneuropaeus]